MRAAVHVHPKVQRRLTAMESRPNAPATAARRARQIIDRLARGEPLSLSGRMSSQSDRRVKNSLKFNLGKGFRLICIRDKQVIHCLFLGNHDDCDVFLDSHGKGGLGKPEISNPEKENLSSLMQKEAVPVNLSPVNTMPGDDCHGSGFFPTQKQLRRIFKGLTR